MVLMMIAGNFCNQLIRLSYNNFTSCISASTNEGGYINCRTNGHMAWVNVMDCYNECQYFDLYSKTLLAGIIAMCLVWIHYDLII